MRAAVTAVVITLILAIGAGVFLLFMLPLAYEAVGTDLPYDKNSFSTFIVTTTLSLGIGLANLFYTRSQEQKLLVPTISIVPRFKPARTENVSEFTHNKLVLDVVNLHSSVSPMMIELRTSFRTVDASSESKQRGLGPASDWKSTIQRLAFLPPNRLCEVQVLLNFEMNVEPLNPKLLNRVQRDGYITWECAPNSVYLEFRIDGTFELSVPNTSRQTIKTVSLFSSPSSGNPIHWSVFVDRVRRIPLETRHGNQAG